MATNPTPTYQPVTLTAGQARQLVALLGAWRPGIDRAGTVTITPSPDGTITVDFPGRVESLPHPLVGGAQ